MYPSGNTGGVVRAVTELCRSVVESCLEPPLFFGDVLPVYCPAEIKFECKRYILR
jgi:hypothetical protein